MTDKDRSHNAFVFKFSVMAAVIETGDIVWARLKGFPVWPAKIVEPKADLKIKKPTKKHVDYYFVFFYGQENYAWVPSEGLFNYEAHRDTYCNPARVRKGYKEAVEASEEEFKKMPPKPPAPELPTIDDEIKLMFNADGSPIKNKKAPIIRKKTPKAKSDEDTPLSALKAQRKRTPTEKVLAARKRPLLTKRDTPVSKKAKLLVKMSKDNDTKNRRSLPLKKHTNLKVMPRPSLPNVKPKYMPQSPISKPSHSSTGVSAGTQFDDSIMSTPGNTSLTTSLTTTPRPYKAVIPTPMRIGFLGLGIMGQGMVMNLMRSGHEVMVWNRTSSKCREFVYDGALKGNTPSDVIAACDITFACVADPNASKDLVFGNSGVLQEMKAGKSYVDMTTMDVDTVEEINEAITQRGGRFLEAPVVGSRVPALEGELVILAAGDKDLCDDCYSCFEAMGKKCMFLGDIGTATRMKLVVNMIIGTMMASLAEGMALAEKTGLDQEDVSTVLGLSSVASEFVNHKTSAIISNKYDAHLPLQHQQKDMRLACLLGDIVEQPLYLASVANELYKKARRFGYGESDISAVYRAANA